MDDAPIQVKAHTRKRVERPMDLTEVSVKLTQVWDSQRRLITTLTELITKLHQMELRLAQLDSRTRAPRQVPMELYHDDTRPAA